MTRRQWTDLALELAKLRGDLVLHVERARSESKRDAHLQRVIGVDLAVRVVCSALRRQSARFDGRRFMRSYATGAAK